ncbi:MAG: xanthine dehydrogenase accessory protein XdhC [Bacteriovoracaceae bacterium]|jgi:xanthine dehydrogenase accessory factor|nr:xanthine dehydrogenase accessory protein XdhC [Bacteriovoracaceae bacterium]
MWDWASKISELESSLSGFVLVTVVNVKGGVPRELGAKMIVVEDGSFFGTVGGGRLEHISISMAQSCMKEGSSRLEKFPLGERTSQCCGGEAHLFFEVLGQRPTLYLFGAGHVGQAVCRVLSETPFQIKVIDERKQWSEKIGDCFGIESICCDPLDFVEKNESLLSSPLSYVAIMTHDHALDEDLVFELSNYSPRFLGLIGSLSKWDRFKKRLNARGVSKETLEKVYCPIGLAIGGKTPGELGISISSQLLEIFHAGESHE